MSRFVSGGTNEEPTERDEAWVKAQEQVEARQLQKVETGRAESGKTLFETLQANKAAKQEAFEESIRLKNQFRSLDEDEAEFLESVLESSRSKEAEVNKETTEQLDAFRRQQEAAGKTEKQSADPEVLVPADVWTHAPRKRKKQKESLGGVKIRRLSSSDKGRLQDTASKLPPAPQVTLPSAKQTSPTGSGSEPKKVAVKHSVPGNADEEPSPTAALGLANYSSDEE